MTLASKWRRSAFDFAPSPPRSHLPSIAFAGVTIPRHYRFLSRHRRLLARRGCHESDSRGDRPSPVIDNDEHDDAPHHDKQYDNHHHLDNNNDNAASNHDAAGAEAPTRAGQACHRPHRGRTNPQLRVVRSR